MNIDLDIAGAAALITALVILFKTFGTRGTDKITTRADAMMKLQSLADLATNKNIELYNRVLNLENSVSDMKGDMRKLLDIHEEWCHGVDSLVTQVKGRGDKPVWEPDTTPLNRLKDKYGIKP